MMGHVAVKALMESETDFMIGVRQGLPIKTGLEDSFSLKHEPPTHLVELARTLSF
jgi:hypothetical protein